MFIFVRIEDNKIVGCSVKPVNVEDMKENGNLVYELDDDDFSYSMIGQTIKEFENYK